MAVLASAALALGLGVAFTAGVRRIAIRLEYVAHPRADRWHRAPVATLGGVGIYAAFVATLLVVQPDAAAALPVVLMATVLFAMGFVDDLRPLTPYAKLVVQLLAAASVVASGTRLPWFDEASLNALVTIFWLVGITNAINLLDNIDGLAAGIAAIGSGFLVVNFFLSGQGEVAVIPAALAGAALGFLVFNFHPASIFMGDSGSMFLGFALAGTALLSEYGRSRNVSAVLFTPVLILMLPIFDTCLVAVTRRLSGRAITRGGRDHASHRLVALGVSERRAVLMLYGFALVCGTLAVAVRFVGAEMALLVIPAFGLVVLFLGLHLGTLAIYDQTDRVPPHSTILQALSDVHHKRRIFEVLLDVVLIALAYYASYLLRFDGRFPPEQFVIFVETVPLVIGVQLAAFLVTGMYRGLWRYVGLDDLVGIARSVGIGVACCAVPVFWLYGVGGMRGASRVVFVLDAILVFLFVGASRLSFRLLRSLIGRAVVAAPGRRPVLIYGAGDGGELLVRELMNNAHYGFAPVGFIDDDQRKVGKHLHGLPIYNRDGLRDVIQTLGVTEVVVSTAKVPESYVQQLRDEGVSLKRMRIVLE
ncbi:MAG: hypothetical protein HYR51_18030 [Candidatus Rokubacteria bacterium]|nr:hypothetical protein [Candidatus Rokubacteria bacterium]